MDLRRVFVKLIVFRGGGYAGCIWEVNWLFTSGQGFEREIQQGYISGGLGEEFIKHLEEGKLTAEDKKDILHTKLIRGNWDADFLKEYPGSTMLAIMNDSMACENSRPKFTCDFCKKKVLHYEFGEDAEPGTSSVHSFCPGGVILMDRDIMCKECVMQRTCGYCGEVFEGDEDKLSEWFKKDGERCENCEGMK